MRFHTELLTNTFSTKKIVSKSGSLFVFFLFFLNLSFSQQVTWGYNFGSANGDYAASNHIDGAGNIYICGEFTGSNIDFDPSASNAFLSSNGMSDGFLAKYNSSGQHQLSFSIGGGNIDKIAAVATDAQGNIYITGFFRGLNVDFDPSSSTAILNSNGDGGGDPGYGGDIFVAKYSATGQYIWAFNIGGSSLGDNGLTIKVDQNANVYVGGYFRTNIDFDPSTSTAFLNADLGTAFIAKYNPAGAYQWAYNFGLANQDNVVYDIDLDLAGNVYITGFFQGTNIDFDPSASTALLSSNGFFDVYVAKYSPSGQYQFAFSVGSFNADVARGITIDNNNNIYIIGDFNGTNIDFDPSTNSNLLSSNSSADVFVAKYTSTGQYVWAFSAGATGTELGWDIDVSSNSVYITGSFSGTSDFNPSAVVDNLASVGDNDIFVGKYSSNGEYQCAFSIGSSGDDSGLGIQVVDNENFYLAGKFLGTGIDFAPSASTFILNSNGSSDAFLAKYFWPPAILPSGILIGDTICVGLNAQLTFTSITGVSPFTIVYSDGVNSFTQSNIMSGVPFNVQINPSTTTLYTVVSIQDALRCSAPNLSPGISATIVVESVAGIQTNNDTTICFGDSVQLVATGAQTYSWTPAASLSNPSIPNPVATPLVFTQYIVTGVTAGGCNASDTVNVSVYQRPNIVISNDTSICKNSSVQLTVTGGIVYLWSPSASLNNPASATPIATPLLGTTYSVLITDLNSCQHIDSVRIDILPDPVFSINTPVDICLNESVQLLASGGNSYNWQPSQGLSGQNIPNPLATPSTTTTYSVTITENTCNQSALLSTVITVHPLPQISVSKSNDIDCTNSQSQLNAVGAVQYFWSPATFLSDPRIANPVATPNLTTSFTVIGSSTAGCSDTATINIQVLNTNKGEYWVPTAFTPNNDGLNDCFRATKWGIINKIEFSIYNRWGQKIFTTNNPADCWDGTFKGVKQDPGVYIYVIKANTSCDDNIFRKGTFVLIR
jgi:gliding motility-associated-like protein